MDIIIFAECMDLDKSPKDEIRPLTEYPHACIP